MKEGKPIGQSSIWLDLLVGSIIAIVIIVVVFLLVGFSMWIKDWPENKCNHYLDYPITMTWANGNQKIYQQHICVDWDMK